MCNIDIFLQIFPIYFAHPGLPSFFPVNQPYMSPSAPSLVRNSWVDIKNKDIKNCKAHCDAMSSYCVKMIYNMGCTRWEKPLHLQRLQLQPLLQGLGAVLPLLWSQEGEKMAPFHQDLWELELYKNK